jgi:hypothetical protein
MYSRCGECFSNKLEDNKTASAEDRNDSTPAFGEMPAECSFLWALPDQGSCKTK